MLLEEFKTHFFNKIEPEQTIHWPGYWRIYTVRNINEYFEDIDAEDRVWNDRLIEYNKKVLKNNADPKNKRRNLVKLIKINSNRTLHSIDTINKAQYFEYWDLIKIRFYINCILYKQLITQLNKTSLYFLKYKIYFFCIDYYLTEQKNIKWF